MVLGSRSNRRRSTAALSLAAAALASLTALAALAGCKEQSLFDEGGKEQEGPGPVGSSCPAQCLGDAARDFNGEPGGATATWRYLEDRRDRSWTPMTPDGGRMLGADPTASISVCDAKSTSPACAVLPKALLIASSGSAAAADPALEFKFAEKVTAQVGLRAFIPESATVQQLLIYRNSREDLLFAGPALPGETFERTLFVDAIPGDRLVVSLAPTSSGPVEIGVELFISNVGTTSRCQIALDFEPGKVAGNTMTGHCGDPFTFYEYEPNNVEQPPVLADGPYPELGKAASIASNHYFKGANVLEKGDEHTWQYWMKINALDPIYDVFVVSDMDLNTYGGIANGVYQRATTNFDTQIGNETDYLGANAEFPHVGKWAFVRLSYANGKLATCINGKRFAPSIDVTATKLKSNFPLYLGKNVVWSSQVAVYDGLLDDVRVLSAALPCE